MKIAFLDMKAPYLELKKELDEAYFRFMNSGWYVLGEEVDSFEREFAEYCGTAFCAGVSNGLDALCLGLEAGGIKAGDEVIVPSNTYIATWLAVSQLGAVPVPVEPESNGFNIDPSLIENAITSKTRAIIPVHLYGVPADMDRIMEIAAKYDLFVLEDNAQSQGTYYKGRRTGSLGHAAAISFYPGKNLGAYGEAGGVTTDSPELADQIKVLRNYGSRQKYYNEVKGYNRRIDGLQAAFLSVKLRVLDEWNKRRTKIANKYITGLSGIEGIVLPEVPEYADPVWHQFIIRSNSRDYLQKRLVGLGVQTMIHYPIPPHLSGAYQDLSFTAGDFPLAERIANEVLSLPIGPHMPEEDCEYVISSIRSLCC